MRSSVVISTLAFVLLIASPASANSITNGDFSAGLNGWDTYGSTWVDNGEAVLDDVQDYIGGLSQSVFVGAGTHQLSFDFLINLSDEVDDFAFPDWFAATLELADDPDPLAATTTQILPLIEANGGLPTSYLMAGTNPNSVGSLVASSKGNDWMTYSVVFETILDFALIDFSFLDGNLIDADSEVRIDNVMLSSTEIPEPSTLMLSIMGLLGLAARRRKHA